MTLIVSLRIPDGIVIAGDSLATMMGNVQVEADLKLKCPHCGKEHQEKAVLPGIPMPSTTLSYAQKVFPFLSDFGVGTFGAGQLIGKTIYFAMRELEKELIGKSTANRPKSVSQVAERIGTRAVEMLKEQVKREKKELKDFPDEWRPLGFQIVGYDADKATTVELHIGKDIKSTTHNTAGITATGQVGVVDAIFSRYNANPQEQPIYEVLSLQDAVTYADFLISTTASHQKFARTIPGVGGEIDIALVTPFDHFTWIRQKSLQSLIAGDRT
jgi:hypothetical protein